MQCARCGTALPGSSAFCMECGAPVAQTARVAAPASAPSPLDVHPLLARANLLRIRGRWSEATEQCAEVLRLDPRNSSAHSLLGDIYENQGRLDDAMHWYELALELSPQSEADQAKLNRVLELAEARRRKAEWEAVIEGKAQPITASAMVRESLQRIGAIAGATVCTVILVMAVLASAADRHMAYGESQDPPIAFGRQTRPRPNPLRSDSQRDVDLMRFLVQSYGSDATQPAGVRVDPRNASATVTILLPRVLFASGTPQEIQERVLREAYRAAYLTYQRDRTLARVDVRALGPTLDARGTEVSDLLFWGSTSVQELLVEPARVSGNELRRFFNRETWWHQDLS